MVDGQRVADLDVRMALESGKLNYKINSLNNVTEIYSKGFNLTKRVVTFDDYKKSKVGREPGFL